MSPIQRVQTTYTPRTRCESVSVRAIHDYVTIRQISVTTFFLKRLAQLLGETYVCRACLEKKKACFARV
jgi:hypothetical protein